jgi:hypothetical protein
MQEDVSQGRSQLDWIPAAIHIGLRLHWTSTADSGARALMGKSETNGRWSNVGRCVEQVDAGLHAFGKKNRNVANSGRQIDVKVAVEAIGNELYKKCCLDPLWLRSRTSPVQCGYRRDPYDP